MARVPVVRPGRLRVAQEGRDSLRAGEVQEHDAEAPTPRRELSKEGRVEARGGGLRPQTL